WSSSFWRPGLRRTIAAETVIFRAQGVGGANSTGGVDQHQLRIFQRSDADAVQLADGGAVAGLQGHAADLHLALRRHQVTEAAGTGEPVRGAFAGLERRAEHARVGADRQRVPVAGDAAGQGDEATGTVLLRDRARAPGRLAALFGSQSRGLPRLGQLVQRQAQVTDAIGVRRRQLARADVLLQRREQQPGDRELRVPLGAQLYVLVFVRVATDVDVVPALVVDRSLGARVARLRIVVAQEQAGPRR